MTFFQNFHASFHQGVFIKWINNFTSKSTLPYMILSEVIWFNSNIHCTKNRISQVLEYHRKLKKTKQILPLHQLFG